MKDVDPYKQLAAILVTTQPTTTIKAIIAGDKKPIIELLKDECRLLDWQGPIIDTLFADLHSVQDAMWLRKKIESMADILIERFNFDRLVYEIYRLAYRVKKNQ